MKRTPLQDGARARGGPLERGVVRGQPGLVGGDHAQRVVQRPELVDLVQVLRAARAGDEPVPGGDPSVDGRDDLPGPRPGSSSRPRQAVLADELLSAHGQPRAGGGALHDEDGRPIGHLRPHEVGQRRDLVGRDVVRHQKNRAPS